MQQAGSSRCSKPPRRLAMCGCTDYQWTQALENLIGALGLETGRLLPTAPSTSDRHIYIGTTSLQAIFLLAAVQLLYMWYDCDQSSTVAITGSGGYKKSGGYYCVQSTFALIS